MTKKIKKLEKETTMWRTRWENSNRALLEMAEEVGHSDTQGEGWGDVTHWGEEGGGCLGNSNRALFREVVIDLNIKGNESLIRQMTPTKMLGFVHVLLEGLLS